MPKVKKKLRVYGGRVSIDHRKEFVITLPTGQKAMTKADDYEIAKAYVEKSLNLEAAA